MGESDRAVARSALSTVVRKSSGALLVLVAWGVASWATDGPTLLPGPAAVGARLVWLFKEGQTLSDVLDTLARGLGGFAIAAMVGIVVGLAIGSSSRLYDAFSGPVDFARSIPVTALYPVFVLALGIGSLSKVGMVATGSALVVILNCAYGVRQSSPTRRSMARLFGASRIETFRLVVVREALPQTMIGLRIALSYAMIVEVVCEMFMGSRHGLGQRIMEAYTMYRIDDLYALVLATGFIGFLLNVLFVRLERHTAAWARAR
jgi:NitT/TauT family transport system permease protein